MNTLTIALYAAGAGQIGILAASALVPRVLDWRTALAPLHPSLMTIPRRQRPPPPAASPNF